MKNIKEEIKEFTKLIKKYPDVQDLYIGRAILYTKTKQYKKALEDYEKGCNYICYDIMNICKRNNLFKEMEGIYIKAINKDKSNTVNYLSRARFYMSIGEDKKALADCETILKISPKNKFVLDIKKFLTEKLKTRQARTTRIKTPLVFE